MGEQIGQKGGAFWRGIPNVTASWVGAGGTRSIAIFTDVTKTMDADVADTRDNMNEIMAKYRTNKRTTIRFSGKPTSGGVSIKPSDALAVAADLPSKMDLITVTSGAAPHDLQLGAITTGSTGVCEDMSARYSPEGEVVIDLTVTFYGNPFSESFSG